ncbi:DUF3303 family protein [Thermodesulfobacteriota bacterium]
MNIEKLGNSKILNLIFKPAGMLMGSRARQWLMDPVKTLQVADIKPSQTILEVGCGTGFFTIPEERVKFHMTNLERIKQGVDSGDLKMWGVSPAGAKGFAIVEGDSKQIFAMTATWTPYVSFKIKPMLSVDEAIDVLKEMQK